jgi:hypothetical protein
VADQTDISQLAPEVAADSSEAQISQAVVEAAASGSTAEIAQLAIETADASSIVQIAQLTIELGRGPEVVPPADNPVGTFTVGAGLGLDWFIALQLSDSGEELRDKVVKSFRFTGKTTNALAKGYGYGPLQDIDIDNIEDGTGQRVTLAPPDTTQVQQSKRYQVNLPNSMMHTWRMEGVWNGEGIPDRIDEIVYEVSRQGIRR